MGQEILMANGDYTGLDDYFKKNGIKKILLVCGPSLRFLRVGGYFDALEHRLGVRVVRFGGFRPNPSYESVVEGVRIFRDEACDSIAAVGGGSAIDVAKCIKLYSNMGPGRNYLQQEPAPNGVRLLAIPTTAGSGSEATRYAVIYFHGEKQSVTDGSIIPGTVLMDASVLGSLPEYQKKSAMMDAFCHAVESFWSVNSNDESRGYARRAVRMILANWEGYISGRAECGMSMLMAANLAGRAINITQTTAGHAMCYKLTGLYGIAHGHAAALCVSRLWPYMLNHMGGCIDPRGEKYLAGVFGEIAETMGCQDAQEAARFFGRVLEGLQLGTPVPRNGKEVEELAVSVNPVRLKNNPVVLGRDAIVGLYREILTPRVG